MDEPEKFVWYHVKCLENAAFFELTMNRVFRQMQILGIASIALLLWQDSGPVYRRVACMQSIGKETKQKAVSTE